MESLFFSTGEEEESSGEEANSTILLQQPVEESLTAAPVKVKMSEASQMKEFFTQMLEKQAEDRRTEREAE